MKSFKKLSNLLALGVIATASLPFILISCNQEVTPEVEQPKPPKPVEPTLPDPTLPPLPEAFLQGGEMSYEASSNVPALTPTVKLKVDKYIQVAQKLKLNQYTNISQLNEKVLNGWLHASSEQDFARLELSIGVNSSQTSGKLILLLNGEYKDHLFQDEPFVISNFPTWTTTELDVVSGPAKILESNFIMDQMDEGNIHTLDMPQFFRFNERPVILRYSFDNKVAPLELDKLNENGLIKNMKFSNVNLNEQDWNIDIEFSQKVYNGTTWEDDKITNPPLKITKYKIEPFNSQEAALRVLASRLNFINDNKILASEALVEAKKDPSTLSKYIEFDEVIRLRYFSNGAVKFKLSGTMTANDVTGILGGTIFLVDSSNNNYETFIRVTIPGFKTSKT